ncbi:MAG: gephyrin-like molybdotransferase Glp [Thermodesulfobacteriota bacterium]
MKPFFKVKTVEEVLGLLERFQPLEAEEVELAGARGRVLAEDLQADEFVPDHDRSAMDGFAVRARDTFGAAETLPALFHLAGEVQMGLEPDFEIGPGQAARIWTGGMLPAGADAVVMIEYSRQVDETSVELSKPAAPWENVIRRGEDVKPGQVLLPAGLALRPQDLGLLAALGRSIVRVTRRPRAALISTGDEVIPITENPGPGRVRDVNTYSLGAMLEGFGAEVIRLGLIPDDPARLRAGVERGLALADLVIVSGGSSMGVRDFAVEVFSSFPGSEILVHGVAVSPGKPLIMAGLGNQSLWGLPGHAVSAMITADVFVRPLLDRLSGKTRLGKPWGRLVQAALARNVPSVHGRQDYIRVRLEQEGGGLKAHPILGKSGLVSTMVKADGLVCIGLNEEGRLAGSLAEVRLFDD